MDRTRVQVVSDVKCGRLQVNYLRKIVIEGLSMLSLSLLAIQIKLNFFLLLALVVCSYLCTSSIKYKTL